MGSHRAAPPRGARRRGPRRRHAGRRPHGRSWLVAAGLVLGLITGIGLISQMPWEPDDRTPAPSLALDSASGVAPTPTATATPLPSPTALPSLTTPGATRTVEARPARENGQTLAPQAPTAIRLPSGRSVRVSTVGTRPDGSLDVPDSVQDAGWWRGGARLASPFGAMLIAAHVDSRTEGLGPFAELLGVGAGQQVTVTSAGLTQTFRLTNRAVIPRDRLSERRDIFAPTGAMRLALVTCAGPYDDDLGYLNLAVLIAEPVAPAGRRAG